MMIMRNYDLSVNDNEALKRVSFWLAVESDPSARSGEGCGAVQCPGGATAEEKGRVVAPDGSQGDLHRGSSE